MDPEKPGSGLTVAVAIPTYQREEVLLETIEQVLAQEPPADEILVIDQTPDHEPSTVARLTAWQNLGKIRWIPHTPANLPGARNRALRETRCSVVLFIDDDVVLTPGFIENHLRNYKDPRVMGVAGRAIQAKGAFPLKQSKSWPRVLDYKYLPLDRGTRLEGIASFSGCNHSVRTDVVRQIGGYDENYSGWAFREETDVAIRLWKSNHMIVFDPDASLVHLLAPAGGCRIKRRLREWEISFPETYLIFRHLFPGFEFWKDVLLANVRRYVLRKDNVFYPWRLPFAAASYLYTVLRAGRIAYQKTFPSTSLEPGSVGIK